MIIQNSSRNLEALSEASMGHHMSEANEVLQPGLKLHCGGQALRKMQAALTSTFGTSAQRR